MRFWIGLSLLSSSWLFGLDYFVQANRMWWASCVALDTLLIILSQWAGASAEGPDGRDGPGNRHPFLSGVVVAVVFVPAIFILPFPFRLAPLLLLVGAVASALTGWLRRVGGGLTLSGLILLVQNVALAAYQHFTARSHELPWPLPSLMAGMSRLLGITAAADGSDLVLSTMRQNHRLGLTWELFLDPATACFMAGGLVALWLTAQREMASHPGAKERVLEKGRSSRQPATPIPPARRPSPARPATGLFLLAILLWLPLQAALNIGIFLHRTLRTDYEAALNLMNQFWNPWPRLLLLLPLALLVAWWTRRFRISSLSFSVPAGSLGNRGAWGALGLGSAAAAMLTLAVLWDPIGSPKPGRIAVDEFHSRWEPTGRAFDTEWYGHLSGYNYSCLYDFCSRYYTMSRLTNSLTDAALANLDVLILKVPTEPFQPGEADAIVRFVDRGGGVLCIGEHTDVFNTGYHLNQVTRHFGFTFRYDCLFGMESFFDQAYVTPRLRHPVLENLRGFDFATSCSIDPGLSSGRGVLVSTGLKNSMADYHANNYYPQAVDHAGMRYGAFVQLWATRHQRGRVLAFTDSTIFSNFSTFEPGKIELLLGMLEWLNRRDSLGNPRPLLLLIGLTLLVGTGLMTFKQPAVSRWLPAAGVFGWSVAALAILLYQASALPVPNAVRPLTWVTIDRTVCDGPLSKGGFIAGKSDGFGIFERWILRLGYFIRRAAGAEALQGDLIVFTYPTKPVTEPFRQALVRYVDAGGNVLILDSPKNEHSTAASLLQPFQLAAIPLALTNAALSGPTNWPVVPLDASYQITGGKDLFRVNGKPVGAFVRHGRGSVVALGFGSRFSDPNMGVTGDVEPDAELRKVFDLQFALIRAIIENKLDGLTPAMK